MLGLKRAISNYACAWDELHKVDRWKMDQHYNYYNTPALSRSLKEIQEICQKSKDNYYCDNEPLLNIDLDHIVVDELHLLLWVTDILLENVVNECIDWDKEDELDWQKGVEHGVHLLKQFGFVVFPSMYWKKKMLMVNPVAKMTVQAYWGLTREFL